MIAQIANGAIDPGWVMCGMGTIITALLFRILNRLETKVNVHDRELAKHDTEIEVIKMSMKSSRLEK